MKNTSGQDGPRKGGRLVLRAGVAGLVGLLMLALEMAAGLVPAAFASGPGGNVADPNVRAVDIAKPAVVRFLSELSGQLTVDFGNGGTVTFPQTPRNGVNGYSFTLLGSGAFISAHGDILTADHVVKPVQDDRQSLDGFVYELAAPDVAKYINQHSTQQVSSTQVQQQLASGQLGSQTKYQTLISEVCMSTDFSGQLKAASFQDLPASQCANIDTIKASSPAAQNDIAIVHVTGMDNMPMLTLGDSTTVHTQDQLSVIGFPGNGDVANDPNTLLTSSVNSVSVSSIKTVNGEPLIQIDGNVGHGDSGGPAIDVNGQIVGVVSFGISDAATSTSYLRASNTAKAMFQGANIDTTVSPQQKAWAQAINDYAATTAGHWHTAAAEFQQIQTQYPNFKAVATYQQYAAQQAKSEPAGTTPGNTSGGTGSGVTSTSGGTGSGLNLTYVAIGGLLALVIVIFGSSMLIVRSRKRKAKAATPPQPVALGYPYPGGSMPPLPGAGMGQGLASSPYAQGTRAPGMPGQMGQMGYSQPQQPQRMPGPPQMPPRLPSTPPPLRSPQPVGGMAAFGAPSNPGASSLGNLDDATIVQQPPTPRLEMRLWPCGHTNRSDARFCGICGEPAPRPLVRRIEQ